MAREAGPGQARIQITGPSAQEAGRIVTAALEAAGWPVRQQSPQPKPPRHLRVITASGEEAS